MFAIVRVEFSSVRSVMCQAVIVGDRSRVCGAADCSSFIISQKNLSFSQYFETDAI